MCRISEGEKSFKVKYTVYRVTSISTLCLIHPIMLDTVVWKDLIIIMNFSCYKLLGKEERGGGVYRCDQVYCSAFLKILERKTFARAPPPFRLIDVNVLNWVVLVSTLFCVIVMILHICTNKAVCCSVRKYKYGVN